MKTKFSFLQLVGLCLIPIAATIYFLVPYNNDFMEGGSLVNFIITGLFFIVSFFDVPIIYKRFRIQFPAINWHIALLLLTISCFTLNKNVHVFNPFPIWLHVALLVSLLAFLMTSFAEIFSARIQRVISFFMGIGLLLFGYFTINLAPLMPIAIIGVIAFGISIHLLAPLFLVITSIVRIYKDRNNTLYPYHLFSGIIVATITTIVYVGLYSFHTGKIKDAQKELILNESNDLPEWVIYAQNSKSPFWIERIIGRGLIYEEFEEEWLDMNLNRGSFSEIKLHDPLVIISSLFNTPVELSDKERISILSSVCDTRHYAYEKLWSGKNLKVGKEVSDIRIYPNCRMAYMEYTTWITNDHKWERNQQEALFTFHLPEGAVATSLSLWIDGKEEKSRLTTRKNASRAYRQIVGVQRRDPVVLHWQEGNRLTATIFPCTPKEPRRVKVGFTIPLIYKNNRLIFENLKVKGPDNRDAETFVHIKMLGEVTGLDLPVGFNRENSNQFLYEGKTIDSWTCSFDSPALLNKKFSFGQYDYSLHYPVKLNQTLLPEEIYLDLNSSWSLREAKMVLSKAGNIPVYCFWGKKMRLNHDNIDNVFSHLSDLSFSLFPRHDFTSVKNKLLITKGYKNSPIPSEIKPSQFYNDLLECINNSVEPMPTISIDGQISPYISTLSQYKLLDIRPVDYQSLEKESIENWFINYQLAEGDVIIPISNMVISKIEKSPKDNEPQAPSHLIRLYNYHSVMQRAGHLFLADSAEIPDEVYKLCNEAFVVTPVSSLIVLETQQDYEQFDIEKNKNSLANANLKDSGAVPEPGEWALIISLILIILVFYFKFKLKSTVQ